MARELLAESHLKEGSTPDAAYGAVANAALGHITERWGAGHGSPGKDTHVRNVHLHKDGKLVGFRLYLIWNEPLRYGKPEIEQLED